MARPKRDTVDYFPHDAHASDDSATIAVLENQFVNDGYAFWYKLLEKLASSDGHFLDWSDPRRLQVFCAKKAHITEEKGVEILNLLVEMGAIDKQLWKNSKVIWCQNLVNNLADVYHNRRREIPLKPVSTPNNDLTTCRNNFAENTPKGVSTPHNAITTPDNSITTPHNSISTDERKGEGRGGKEIKEETKEESISVESIINAYQDNILDGGTVTEEIDRELRGACEKYTPEWVADAIKSSIRQHNPRWKNIMAIMQDWSKHGKEPTDGQ